MPHFLFTYANDQQSPSGFLRALARERKAVKAAMNLAEQMGLCQRDFIDDASARDIIDAFQRHSSEVVLFHYGGHADSFDLLLQDQSGGGNQKAGGEGLVSFLGRQRGLKIVLLNGCHTLPLAESLIEAGVPLVIGTHRAINDQVATLWATRFYQGLGVGLSIQRAFDDAVDEVRMSPHGRDQRGLYRRNSEKLPSDVPWSMQISPEQEAIQHWSLTQFDPLLGLPVPPVAIDLPDPPFLFFRRYDRAHAPVFFGRSQHIRLLYDRIATPDSPPLILLHGQSGSGKSSLFEAGLVPRLKADYVVQYLRRDWQVGLQDTLLGALQNLVQESSPLQQTTANTDELFSLLDQLEQKLQDQPWDRAIQQQLQGLRALKQRLPETEDTSREHDYAPLLRYWHQIETQTKRPLVLILDQIEEVFIQKDKRGSEKEWQVFINALSNLFGHSLTRPKGKLILGFRKEYFPEVEKALQTAMLPRSSIFLPALSRPEIEEIVLGLSSRQKLRERYQLQVDTELPSIIANELLQQEESLVAPILQIMLTNMWEAAKNISPHQPKFTLELYRYLKSQWWQLDKFVKAQIDKIASAYPVEVEQGLLLDLLYEHTNSANTSQSNTLQNLEIQYSHIPKLRDLLLAGETNLLLKHYGATYSLSHDTLAPTIRSMYQQSSLAAQRARHILEGRVREPGAVHPPPLDHYDLAQVQRGVAYMRCLNEAEEKLLTQSEALERKRQRQRVRVKGALIGLGTIVMVAAGILYWLQAKNIKLELTLTEKREQSDRLAVAILDKQAQLDQSELQLDKQKKSIVELQDIGQDLAAKADRNELQAAAAERLFAANQLAANALTYLREGKKYEALQSAVAAYQQAPASPAVLVALLNTAYDTLPIIQPMQDTYRFLPEDQQHPKGYHLSDLKSFRFIVSNKAGESKYIYPEASFLDEAPRFIEDHPDRAYFKLKEEAQVVIWEPVLSLKETESNISGKIIGLTDGGAASGLIWAADDGQIGQIGGPPEQQINGRIPLANSIQSIDLSTNDQFLLTQGTKLQLYKSSTWIPGLKFLPQDSSLAYKQAHFSPSNRFIIATQTPGKPIIYDLRSRKIISELIAPATKDATLLDAIFSPDERYVLCRDNTHLYLWDWQNQILLNTQTYTAEITALSFSPDGNYLTLGSADQTLSVVPWQGANTKFESKRDVAFTLDASIIDVAFWNKNGLRIVIAAGNKLHFYDWESHLPLGSFAVEEQLQNVVISANGRQLWAGTNDGIIGPILLDPKLLVERINQHIHPEL